MLARVLVGSISVHAVGCLVPAPVQEETGTVNYPPVIVSCMPDFIGVHNVPTQAQAVEFEVTAVDQDLGDTLVARQYLLQNQSLTPTQADLPLQATDATDRAVRRGTFAGLPVCKLYNLNNQEAFFYVYVTDSTFPDGFAGALPSAGSAGAGHYDYKYWVLKCP